MDPCRAWKLPVIPGVLVPCARAAMRVKPGLGELPTLLSVPNLPTSHLLPTG